MYHLVPNSPIVVSISQTNIVEVGGEWGGNVTFLFWERSVLLPFPLGIYTIIYPVPTYACTVYVYTMELGGGGEELDVIGEVE